MIYYFVNEKRRSVIAVLRRTSMDEVNSIIRKSQSAHPPVSVIQAAIMPESFRVEVKCAPEDKFDVEIGKRLARMRILDNYDRSRKKAHQRALDAWDDYVERIDNALDE